MRSRNNYERLEPEIVKQLKYHAWHLKQMKCFESQEIEDIEQDTYCLRFGRLYPSLNAQKIVLQLLSINFFRAVAII